MPIPDFQTMMLPFLKAASDGNERSVHYFVDVLAKDFNISQEELDEFLPSSKQTRFFNRVGWVKTDLTKAGLMELTHRPLYKISELFGREVLKKNPSRIDMKFLDQFPEYHEFRTARKEVVVEEWNRENQIKLLKKFWRMLTKKLEVTLLLICWKV